MDAARSSVEADDLVHQDFGVAVVAQDGADRLRDVSGREDRERNLIEQRLKGVVVLAVDDRDINGKLAEMPGRVDAAEPCADDHNSRASAGRAAVRHEPSCIEGCAARRFRR